MSTQTISPLTRPHSFESPPHFSSKVSVEEVAPDFIKKQMEFLKAEYERIAASQLKKDPELSVMEYAGFVGFIPAQFSLHMPGCAVLAERLIKKYHLENRLFVCKTMESFTNKIKEIKTSNQDQTIVCIVPAYDSFACKHHRTPNTIAPEPNFPQHKVAILIEKKQGEIYIALMNTELDDEAINASRCLGKQLWDGLGQIPQGEQGYIVREQLLRAILLAELDPTRTQIFYNNIPRETVFGCIYFALHDAIAFLVKSPQFFQNIHIDSSKSLSIGDFVLREITRFPGEYMVGTQSYRQLNAYFKEGSSTVCRKGKDIPLEQFLEIYSTVDQNGKKKNLYIQRKMLKQWKLFLEIFEKSPPNELKKSLQGILLDSQDSLERAIQASTETPSK